MSERRTADERRRQTCATVADEMQRADDDGQGRPGTMKCSELGQITNRNTRRPWFFPAPRRPNRRRPRSPHQRSHGRDFACCPADSALAASVAVRLQASEGPVGRWESVARFASCVATQVISPFTSRPHHRFLRANACQHRSAHHPAADRVPPYQQHCHIWRSNGFDSQSGRFRPRVGAPGHAAGHPRLEARPVASNSFRRTGGKPYFTVPSRRLPASPPGVWLASSGIFARHGAPHQSPPADVHRALKHGQFSRRRSLPSHSGHQSEHPPWDRCPDAIAL